jgi:peptidoglycan/xylan/chitin deacetylase (PgdA/CDA1 family)
MLTPNPTRLSIPAGTICLTFDDGPGARTLEIAQLLARHDMCATFFVVGKRVQRNVETVRQVRSLGHWIGNHTFHHRLLAALVWAGVDVASEIVETDRLIADFVDEGPFLLRPPYGNWSANVAATLNRSDVLQKYIGPVMWDIDFADYDIGGIRNNEPWTLEKCRAAYLNEIEARQAGVVLLHDDCTDASAAGDKRRAKNRTFELLDWLVPRIKGRYEFKALDEVFRQRQ